MVFMMTLGVFYFLPECSAAKSPSLQKVRHDTTFELFLLPNIIIIFNILSHRFPFEPFRLVQPHVRLTFLNVMLLLNDIIKSLIYFELSKVL